MKANLNGIFENAPKARPLELDSDATVTLVESFCYIGSVIDYFLDNSSYIRIHVIKVNKAMGSLSFT